MGNVKHIQTEDLNRIRDYFHWRNKTVILNLINIGVNVALRISDLQNLKFQDINEDGTIRVKEKKTKKIRIIALNNVCIKSIKELKKFYSTLGYSTKTGYLFKSLNRYYTKNKEDHHISTTSVNRYLKEARDYLNINYPIGTHSLRKTWGYNVYKKTQNIALVMKALNHSSPGITLRYLGIEQEQLNKTYLEFEL